MPKVTNFSRGVRTFNIFTGEKGENDVPVTAQVSLMPGQTSEDVKLMGEEDKVFAAMVEAGELGVGKTTPERVNPEDEFRNDPNFKAQVEAATKAGTTPGLSDGLPDKRQLEEITASKKQAEEHQAESDKKAKREERQTTKKSEKE